MEVFQMMPANRKYKIDLSILMFYVKTNNKIENDKLLTAGTIDYF